METKFLYKKADYYDELNKFFEAYPNAKEELIDDIYNQLEYYISYDEISEMYHLSYDPEENGNIYRQLQDLSADDMLNDLGSDVIDSSLIYDYEDADEDRFDEDEIRDLAFEYCIEHKASDFQDTLDEAVKQFIHENANAIGFNEYGNTYGNTNDTLDNSEPINDDYELEADNITDLKALEDKIDDPVQLNFSIDYPKRDYPFIYIDGEVYQGNSQQSHGQLINKYLFDNGKEQNKERWYRPSKTSLEQSFDNLPIAFGSVYNNIAFIEVTEHCNEADVLNTLKNDFEFDKIYSYKQSNTPNAVRLAKKY